MSYGVLRQVTDSAGVLLAENPGVMTLDGTNTWVLRAPGAESAVVVDPGPPGTHLDRLEALGPVELVLLTHGHPDHSEGAVEFGRRVDAPVRAVDPTFRTGTGLDHDEVIKAGGLDLTVLRTPGHTSDSVCFVLADAVLTGDTVLGRGTTIVAHPDGRLGDYLASLRLLAGLPPGRLVLPGHGPVLPDVVAAAAGYLAHRGQRLDQVRAAVAELGGTPTPRQVVELVYRDVDQSLWPAAEWSVRAQLEYLREAGA
ncbi:MBL fold metallo-hydrolase [Saccharothrix violaceirubra]|uniref:Glyoxylase-like metal-dependent hydrolase (Beta-lactamase superfamily II) n=1 Tax=Saccharothrix violaceirubra TaxID=413306 RepID=A0A7W7T9A7_9PSEU|nr:MBL fold metallo-hydrolase [Saccharothrix violaceirubra]MBB4968953.1 glyoxylase-like metal-dependent hydrolase (beta-lactamase superfamily II) [Saccharothrix violaceirubra]